MLLWSSTSKGILKARGASGLAGEPQKWAGGDLGLAEGTSGWRKKPEDWLEKPQDGREERYDWLEVP